MRVSKRQFLKTGVGGTALLFMQPFWEPKLLSANPVEVPTRYFRGPLHARWMKLSYNDGRESRQLRKTIGASLRGYGDEAAFHQAFEEALNRVFQNWVEGTSKPKSVFGLIQAIYEAMPDDPEAGRRLFGVLFYLTRGRDGTEAGEVAHAHYRDYRQAVLNYKSLARTSEDPDQVVTARQLKDQWLATWQNDLNLLVEAYASRQRRLDPEVVLELQMLDGFAIEEVSPAGPALAIRRMQDRVEIRWEGEAVLQRAAALRGPWSDTQQISPATILTDDRLGFFRTVSPSRVP